MGKNAQKMGKLAKKEPKKTARQARKKQKTRLISQFQNTKKQGENLGKSSHDHYLVAFFSGKNEENEDFSEKSIKNNSGKN